MPPSFDGVSLLFPSAVDWAAWTSQKCDKPFSEAVVEFLSALSSVLLKDSAARNFPDVATFGFFCRRANLQVLQKTHCTEGGRLGRGILLHIAPSNVPINFAYSLVAGLLSGNRNIVRVPSKPFPQVDMVLRAFEALAHEHSAIADRIVLVRYERGSNATTEFSALCDVRIIWGGDDTIALIRKSAIPPRSFDVTFADRYSIAIINAEKLIVERDIKKIAHVFYNDTYLFDQNACSAPHLVVWFGEKGVVAAAQDQFWKEVQSVAKEKYELNAVVAVRKLAAFYTQAAALPIKKEGEHGNLLWRIRLESLDPAIDEFRSAGGYFAEYVAGHLDELVPIVSRKYQTLAYFGFDPKWLVSFVVENRLSGIDRVVPFGRTTDFSLTWDGYDLIRTLTRKVSML